MIEERIKRKGIIPPEILGMDKKLFEEIQQILKGKGIELKEKIEKI
jgi:saccharopine dehydrogenase-like NADP-dependent oxidoreductase